MNPNMQRLYEQYKEVVHDMIVGRRSTKRILARTYSNEQGQQYKVPEEIIPTLKKIASAKRDEVMEPKNNKNSMNTPHNNATDNSLQGISSASEITKPAFGGMNNFDQQTLNVYMQNAQMNAQMNFLQQQLRDKQSELDQMRNQGLGSIETQIDYQFTKRKNQELTELVAKQEKEIKELEQELDVLQAKADRLHELQGYANMGKEVLPQLLQVYGAMRDPSAAQALAGVQTQHELSESDQQAMQTGQFIFKNFNTHGDYNKVIDILHHCSQDKRLLNACLHAISSAQQQVKKTKRTTEEVEYGEAAA